MTDTRLERRERLLRDRFGARPDVARDLIAYDPLPYQPAPESAPPQLPLDDEPLVASWTRYADEADAGGVFDTLRRHLVQLRFPIRAGISESDAYRAATRRGDFEAADEGGLSLRSPKALELSVPASMAGRVPVLVAGDRADFITLVQALTGRNEPVDVPDAMGACLVKGLNNWSRVADYRRAWATSRGGDDEVEWADAFKQLIPQKALYQDRLVILSRGPYSAVPAEAVGRAEGAWISDSVAIRREHELTHYLTYRVFGTMRSHVVDELLADFVGLVRGTGRYDAAMALRFLGLEAFPHYRAGGRLEHYRGEPALGTDAFVLVQDLASRAAQNLADISTRGFVDDLETLGRLTLALISLSLEELASRDIALETADTAA